MIQLVIVIINESTTNEFIDPQRMTLVQPRQVTGCQLTMKNFPCVYI